MNCIQLVVKNKPFFGFLAYRKNRTHIFNNIKRDRRDNPAHFDEPVAA